MHIGTSPWRRCLGDTMRRFLSHPLILGLSPALAHPTPSGTNVQGVREDLHPGYQYYRVHLFA